MESYFIDTSVAIDFIRGKTSTVNFINALDAYFYVNYVVVCELCEGIFQVTNTKELEKGIKNFLEGMYEITNFDYETAKTFGMIRAGLRKRGNIIEDLDILIAATCLANNLTLITSNKKHFSRISGLNVLSPEDFKN